LRVNQPLIFAISREDKVDKSDESSSIIVSITFAIGLIIFGIVMLIAGFLVEASSSFERLLWLAIGFALLAAGVLIFKRMSRSGEPVLKVPQGNHRSLGRYDGNEVSDEVDDESELQWIIKRLEEDNKRLLGSICCVRCKTYYRKELEACPACSGLKNETLTEALKERKGFRVSLGIMMMIGAVLFFVVVMVLGKLVE